MAQFSLTKTKRQAVPAVKTTIPLGISMTLCLFVEDEAIQLYFSNSLKVPNNVSSCNNINASIKYPNRCHGFLVTLKEFYVLKEKLMDTILGLCEPTGNPGCHETIRDPGLSCDINVCNLTVKNDGAILVYGLHYGHMVFTSDDVGCLMKILQDNYIQEIASKINS